jgi:putative nucleotidyltransferase with HDIG domain
MPWNINTLVPLIAVLLYGGLYLVVSFSRPRTESRRRFRWYLLSMASWSISALLILVDSSRATFWFRVMISSTLITMASLYSFTIIITEKRHHWDWVIPIFTLVMIAINLGTDWVVQSVSVQQGLVDYEFSSLIALVAGPGYLFMIISLSMLIQAYRQTQDVLSRNRLLYLIFGIGLIIGASPLNFTPLGQYPVDIAANALAALLIAYTILRFQLLDISLVIRKGLIYSIPTVLISTMYFLTLALALRIFNELAGLEIFLVSLTVAVVTAIIAEPVRNQAQSWIDRIFFREKYDSRLMLQHLSGRTTSVLDLDQISNMILDQLSSTLHIEKAGILLKEEESKHFTLISHTGLPEGTTIDMRYNHPVVLWLSGHEGPLVEREIEISPHFQSLWKQEREDLDLLDPALFIPLRVQNELVGILSIGQKKSGENYDRDDRLTLSTLANQTAVAVENARLYTAEQNRRKEMDTLYNMARQLVKTDNLEEILDTIARQAVISTKTSYARILTRDEEGSFFCHTIYQHPDQNLDLGLEQIEPLVAEHFYSWLLKQGKTLVLDRKSPELREEERKAIFLEQTKYLCISPLIGSEDYFGMLLLGELPGDNPQPFDSARVRLVNVIADHAVNAIQRAALHKQLEENFIQTVVSLANAMDARDSYTGHHSQRMANLATDVCETLGLSEERIEAMHWAALLHDIGKIGVPDNILNKAGALTEQEWQTMKRHPQIGAEIVSPVKMLEPVGPIIQAHHERFDGTGYPFGLKKEQIPVEARVLAVVDAYIAITDERVYREGRSHEEAIAEIRRHSGKQFDPRIVDIFCKLIDSPEKTDGKPRA